MNHCVPDCDEFGADDGKAVEIIKEQFKPSLRQLSFNCSSSENDFSELIWTTDGNLVTNRGTERSSHWLQSSTSEDRVAPSCNPSNNNNNSTRAKDGTLDSLVISGGALGVAAPGDPFPAQEEDDLISWLQYPDDSIEKVNNCSDIFNSSSAPQGNVQILKEVPRPPVPVPEANPGDDDVPSLGIATSSTGKISSDPESQSKWVAPSEAPACSMLPPRPHSNNRGSGTTATATTTVTSMTTKGGAFNFSHFSRPAAIAKASLHTLGKCSTSITNHLQEQFRKNEVQNHSGVVVSGTTTPTTTRVAAAPAGVVGSSSTSTLAVEGSMGSAATQRSAVNQTNRNNSRKQSSSQSSWPSLRSYSSRREGGPTGRESNQPSSSVGADGQELAVTSSSGGSGNSGDRRRSPAKTEKRKSKEIEESAECQSEDVEGESLDVKKTRAARTGCKRSRAAEVHNLSERRRRDRINEKMKALQELIPNSNKTDKASMLDEAIEYLKMLQLQLQMMSMRSGLSLPPMIIPAGMQHLQMPQLPAHVGMGMNVGMQLGMGFGMGMGMGVGLLDASGRPVVQLPAAQPGAAASMPVNMDMYHAYILQQQLQHQQLQLRLQQQQQQQQQQSQLQSQQKKDGVIQ